MASLDSDSIEQTATHSNGQSSTLPASLVTTTSSTAASDGTSEQNSAKSPPRTPPATPLSTRATLASQSTSKSKYNRRFDKKFLATPSSNGSGSPISKKQPSTHGSPEPPARPLTPPQAEPEPFSPDSPKLPAPIQQLSGPPQAPRSRHAAQYPPYSLYQQATVPGYGYYANSVGPGLPPLGPQNNFYQLPPYYLPASLSGPAMPFATNFRPTPSPPEPPSDRSPAYSNTSPHYGGEAYHHVPIGINPSPPAPRLPAYDTHAVPPTEPIIPEYPSGGDTLEEPPAQPQGVQAPPKPEKKDEGKEKKPHWWRRHP